MPPRKTGAAGSKKGTKAKSAADQPADEIAPDIPDPPPTAVSLLDKIPSGVKQEGVKLIASLRKGFFFAKNDQALSPNRPNIFNNRELVQVRAATLAEEINDHDQRAAYPIIYITSRDAIPDLSVLAKTKDQLLQLDGKTWFLDFATGVIVWRIAGNHRVEANVIFFNCCKRDIADIEAVLKTVLPQDPDRPRLEDRLASRKASIKVSETWPAELYFLEDFLNVKTWTFHSAAHEAAMNLMTINKQTYQWLGETPEIFRRLTGMIKGAGENDSSYGATYLAGALGKDATKMSDAMIAALYNPFARSFLLEASHYSFSTISFEPSLLRRAWTTTAGCSWAYVILQASIQPRIKVHLDTSACAHIQHPEAVAAIDRAITRAYKIVSHYVKVGKWSLTMQSQAAIVYFQKIESELKAGLSDWPKYNPEVHKALVASATAIVKIMKSALVNNSFCPVYCQAFIDSLQDIFTAIPYGFRFLEAVTDVTTALRGSNTGAHRHRKNYDPSAGFLRCFYAFDGSLSNAVFNGEYYLASPFLFNFIVNDIGPHEGFIRHTFRHFLFPPGTKGKNLLNHTVGPLHDPNTEADRQMFTDLFSSQIWGTGDAVEPDHFPDTSSAVGWYFGAYHWSEKMKSDHRALTIRVKGTSHLLEIYAYITLVREQLDSVFIHSMQHDGLRKAVTSLLNIPVHTEDGTYDLAKPPFALPLVPGYLSQGELDDALNEALEAQTALSDIDATDWELEDSVAAAEIAKSRPKVKPEPATSTAPSVRDPGDAGFAPLVSAIRSMQAAAVKHSGMLTQLGRTEVAAHVDTFVENLTNTFLYDAFTRSKLVAPKPPPEVTQKMDVSTMMFKRQLKWVKGGIPWEGDQRNLVQINPFAKKDEDKEDMYERQPSDIASRKAPGASTSKPKQVLPTAPESSNVLPVIKARLNPPSARLGPASAGKVPEIVDDETQDRAKSTREHVVTNVKGDAMEVDGSISSSNKLKRTSPDTPKSPVAASAPKKLKSGGMPKLVADKVVIARGGHGPAANPT